MEGLIKAIRIFQKYGEPESHCEHDEFRIYYINPDKVSKEDLKTIEELSFYRR